METTNSVAAIVSIILGVYAIWLSIVFYRMSVAASGKLEKASSDVADNVKRLEALFDRMYSDTFSLVRDTYADMRREMWSKHEGVSESAQESVGPTPDPSIQLPLPLPPPVVVDRPTHRRGGAKRIPPGDLQIRDAMRRALARMWGEGKPVTATNLTDIAERLGSDPRKAVDALFEMRDSKEFYPVGDSLGPLTRLVRSADEANRLYEENIEEQLDEVLGETQPGS